MVAVALGALLGMAAFSVDLGMLALGRQQLQNAADAAALAGANAMRTGMQVQVAVDAAVATAAQNKVLGDALTLDPSVDVKVGLWNATTKTIDAWFTSSTGEVAAEGGTLAIQVTCRRTGEAPDGPIPAHFARIFGINSLNARATSVAGLSVQSRQRAPVECIILQDYSGSFSGEFTQARDANYTFVNLFGTVAVAGASAGNGDKCGYVGFGDYVINSTNYPSSGWTTDTKYPKYGAWSNSSVSKSYPMDLTRLDKSTDLTTAKNKFYTSSSSKVTYVACGSNDDPERYKTTGNYYTSSTNTAAALDYSINMFKNSDGSWKNPDAQHVVVLMSDGMPFYHNPAKPQGYKDKYNLWVPAKEEVWSKAQTLAAANRVGAAGIRLHTVTLCQDSGGTSYGFSGSDAAYNASLVQNGGYAFLTPDAAKLTDLMVGVASVEIGSASLLQ